MLLRSQNRDSPPVLLEVSPQTLPFNHAVFDSPSKNSEFKVLTLKSTTFLPTAELQFSGREPIFRPVLIFLWKKKAVQFFRPILIWGVPILCRTFQMREFGTSHYNQITKRVTSHPWWWDYCVVDVPSGLDLYDVPFFKELCFFFYFQIMGTRTHLL